MKTYQDFQSESSSEKVTLAIIRGSKKLSGFILDSGVYKLSNFDAAVIPILTVNGEEIPPVSDASLLVPGTYFNDRANKQLHIILIGGASPNTKFVSVTQKYFFSDKGVALPHDLASGFDVYFEPLIKSTSTFGVELDVLNEATSAIEGQGSITFHNDFDFWPSNFDKVFFENQIAEIFSWNPELKANQAKLLFRGYVDSKSYSSTTVKFTIKDLLYNLRATIDLKDVQELQLRNDPALSTAKQRLVYGKVQGHRPVNLDKLLNGSYPITGTVSVFFNSTSVVGTGTLFKSELSINDKLVINGAQFTVAKITSDNTLELTSAYPTVTLGNLSVEVVPATNKTYINREWLLAGHALSQPTYIIQHGSTTQRLTLNTTLDLYDGDDIYIGPVGSGELVKIDKVINTNTITLSQSTAIVYGSGTEMHRPCVQNVKMNDLELVYLDDYTVDPNSARLTLTRQAEENRAPLLESPDRITVTSGQDYFTGSGTKFTSYIKPGYKVRPQSTDAFYKVLEVTDTQIKLTENYTGPSFTTATALPEKTAISGLNNMKERYLFRAVPYSTAMQGSYFKIWDSQGSVAVWFDIGNVGTEEPEHGCDRSIEITTVEAGDNQYTILKKISQKLNLDDEFKCSISGDTITIENNKMGVRPAAKDSDTGFGVLSRSKSEQRVICVADVADSLDQKYFTLYDNVGPVAFWIAVDNNLGAVEPNHGCYRSVKITTINTDDSANTVRDKVKAYVEADSSFTTSNYGTDGFIATCSMVGAGVGTMPTGFTISVSQEGKSAYYLNGKYFVLPHHYAGTDRTAGFWFDIDNSGTAAPSTGATANTEINTVTSEMDEAQIFEAISNIIEAHPNFTSEYSSNSILVTDVASENVTTQLNVGTSELTIVQVQAGVTSNPLAGKFLQYKSFVFGDGDTLSCDIYGKTVEGNTSSRMLKTAPEIVRDLLIMAGSGNYINEANFASAQSYFNEDLAFCVPRTYNDKGSGLSYRDVINSINGSVLGVLLQSNSFELEYSKLKPHANVAMRLDQADILDFSVSSTNKNMIQRAIVEYAYKEYDSIAKTSLTSSTSKTSNIASYILKTSKSKVFDSLCINSFDAQRLADRWAFILEYSSNSFTFSTKLQTAHLQINDLLLIEHPKMYERMGSSSQAKIVMIESIAKKGDLVEITAIDLSNAFNRVAKITDSTTSWANASEESKLLGGFYKDNEGLIGTDPTSADTNLVW